MPKETELAHLMGIYNHNERYDRVRVLKSSKHLIIGDIHGCNAPLNSMLKHWNKKDETLVLLGDYVSKGTQTKKVLDTVSELYNSHENVVALRGNHENLFLKFLDFPKEHADLYYESGGREDIVSLLGEFVDWNDPQYIADTIMNHYPREVEFLNRTQINYQTELKGGKNLYCSHAGFDLTKGNFLDTEPFDNLTIRDKFHHATIEDEKVLFVSGHTPTKWLNSDGSDDVWFKDNKYVIDGNIPNGGLLHGLYTDGIETKVYSYDKYGNKKA